MPHTFVRNGLSTARPSQNLGRREDDEMTPEDAVQQASEMLAGVGKELVKISKEPNGPLALREGGGLLKRLDEFADTFAEILEGTGNDPRIAERAKAAILAKLPVITAQAGGQRTEEREPGRISGSEAASGRLLDVGRRLARAARQPGGAVKVAPGSRFMRALDLATEQYADALEADGRDPSSAFGAREEIISRLPTVTPKFVKFDPGQAGGTLDPITNQPTISVVNPKTFAPAKRVKRTTNDVLVEAADFLIKNPKKALPPGLARAVDVVKPADLIRALLGLSGAGVSGVPGVAPANPVAPPPGVTPPVAGATGGATPGLISDEAQLSPDQRARLGRARAAVDEQPFAEREIRNKLKTFGINPNLL